MTGREPAVEKRTLPLPEPGLGDNRSPEKRLRDSLGNFYSEPVFIPLETARKLPKVLKQGDFNVDAVAVFGKCGWNVAEVSPSGTLSGIYGMAIDLGSTSVVFYLADLETGETVRTLSLENPQREHGEDILDRILFAGRGGLSTLQKEAVDLINKAVTELTEKEGISADSIYYCTVAGNTTMCHFLLALDPSHICREPYIPAVNKFDLLRPAELGIRMHPQGLIYVLPNVGSYFGGDLLAGILASGMFQEEKISMLVDVGTNAEVVLGNKDWLVACAGAAGPALEGGILSCGMRAQEGAVERIRISPDNFSVRYETIGGTPPRGLCGSAIIDLLAEMFRAGLVDPTGKLMPDKAPERFRKIDEEWAFVVADEVETGTGRPVYITQSDIKNLIRSKGAMYTILNVVIQSVGITFQDIDNFYVAGAFGNYIDPENAITIGMLPDVALETFKGLGNSAGMGAVKVLLDRNARKELDEICERITYLEMNVRGDFMNQLTGALFLPHTDLSRFPTVAKRLNLQ